MNRRVVLGVTGSIAAYKAAELVRLLKKAGAEVEVIMTRAATEFLAPLTLATLSERPVTVGMWDPPVFPSGGQDTDRAESAGNDPAAHPGSAAAPIPAWNGPEHHGGASTIGHIRASREADLLLVAPATANLLGKVAHGIADDALTTTILASSAPVLFAPAMNTRMWDNPAVQENLRILRSRGYFFVESPVGDLACGEFGAGRMAEPGRILGEALRRIAVASSSPGSLLVTTGGTEEPIDPVRCLTNRSSGRMGFAVAEAGRDLGYRVTVIQGRTSVEPPAGVDLVPVRTAAEMEREVRRLHPKHDVLVMTAAVADYRPRKVSPSKIASGRTGLRLDLVPNPDVLRGIRGKRAFGVTIGFALETGSAGGRNTAAARRKLEEKGLDLIVLNNPLRKGSGFGSDLNEVELLAADGRHEKLPLLSKYEVAVEILRRAARLRESRRSPLEPSQRPTRRAPQGKPRPSPASRGRGR